MIQNSSPKRTLAKMSPQRPALGTCRGQALNVHTGGGGGSRRKDANALDSTIRGILLEQFQ